MLHAAAHSKGLLAGLGCGAAVIAALWTGIPSKPPEWLAHIDALPAGVRPANDICTDADAASIDFIERDLLRRPMWRDEEARHLTAIVERGYPKATRDLSQSREERSQAFVFQAAIQAIEARLSFSAPMTPEVRRTLIEVLVRELDAPFPERRVIAASGLIDIAAIEDRTIRAAVEHLLDDPDANAAEDIGFILARYDEEKTRRLRRAPEMK